MKPFILLLFIFSGLSLAQNDHPSIHQLEWQQHLKAYAPQHSTEDVPIQVRPLQQSLKKTSGLSGTVFGYLPDWEYANALDNLHFDLLTHIACFDFTVAADGSISNPAGWPWTNIINKAHDNGVKVILTAVNFNKDDIRNIISNNTVKKNFIKNVKSKMQAYGLDGVNIDFEGLYDADKGVVINSFMSELSDSIHSAFPGSEVSFAGPAVNWGNAWDLNGLAASCDYIFIMGYAFSGSWSNTSGSTAPLTGGTINITNTVVSQYGGVDPQKLILGVPYYGEKFQTATKDPFSSVQDYIGAERYRSALSGYASYGMRWNEETQSPWYRYQSGGKWYQSWVDTDSSISAKFSLARSHDYKGVGMWALNYDGSSVNLWNVIQRHFLEGGQPLPTEPYAAYVLPGADSSQATVYADVVLYADGYRLYWGTNPEQLNDSLSTTNLPLSLTGLSPDSIYYMRLVSYNGSGKSSPTSMLAVSTGGDGEVLIVDGFDRQGGTVNPRDYIKRHAPAVKAAGYVLASATNEAVESGRLGLAGYSFVDWFLGDESTAESTFSAAEQNKIKTFMSGGGRLFVSGAEIGWDLVAKGSDGDKAFYRDYLKAQYKNDAPFNKSGEYYSARGIAASAFEDMPVFSFDDGSHGSFDVDWPDAITAVSGAHNGFTFENVPLSEGGAGVYYNGPFGSGTYEGKLVHMSIPFETIYPESRRMELMGSIARYFETATALTPEAALPPRDFVLLGNRPNPFNPSTEILFRLERGGQVTLTVFDSRGRLVYNSPARRFSAGSHSLRWQGKNNRARDVASGSYFYTLTFKNGRTAQRLNGKMVLLR